MKTKIIPFDLEMAKKIQDGKIEGRIVNRQTETVRIFAFDVQNKKCIVGAVKHALSDGEYIANWNTEGRAFDDLDVKESFLDLVIELPEETPKQNSFTKKLHDTTEVLAIPKHEFKPFDKVLVRKNDDDKQYWQPKTYSFFHPAFEEHVTTDGMMYAEMLPYEGNEHLVGTTDNPK